MLPNATQAEGEVVQRHKEIEGSKRKLTQ